MGEWRGWGGGEDKSMCVGRSRSWSGGGGEVNGVGEGGGEFADGMGLNVELGVRLKVKMGVKVEMR